MTAQPHDFEGVTFDRVRDLLGYQCSSIDCEKLEKDVTKEEIMEYYLKCQEINHLDRMDTHLNSSKKRGQS